MLIKVDMPSGDVPTKNLGECAVLACATTRGMIAVIDDGDARAQARARNLRFVTTMHIVIEAYKRSRDTAKKPSNSMKPCSRPTCACRGSTA